MSVLRFRVHATRQADWLQKVRPGSSTTPHDSLSQMRQTVQMATETMKPDVMTGEPMTEDEQFLLGWARESLKATIPRLDDALQKMVTLAVALAGGGVVALRDDLMPHPAFRVVAVGAFVLAALLAFCGGFLLWHGMDDEDPEDIWRVKSEAMRHKYNYYVATAVMFGTGFAVVLTGLVVRMAW